MIYDHLVKTTRLRIIYRGSKWDTFRAECCISWIVMNHRCEERGLLCREREREREGEWDVGTFWGLSERDKVRTRRWVIVLIALQVAPALTSSQPAGVELTGRGEHTLHWRSLDFDLVACQQLLSSSRLTDTAHIIYDLKHICNIFVQ